LFSIYRKTLSKLLVLSLDDFDFSQKGIIHKNVIKWLLEETQEGSLLD